MTATLSCLLPPAELVWQETQPFARDYGDIYYAEDGEQEVERVFLEPCGLNDAQPGLLRVGETGFGTGLNFAVLAEKIIRCPGARLTFYSFEAHPLTRSDWQQVAARSPHLTVLHALAASPLPLLPGWHQRSFADGRVVLNVFHGEVLSGLNDMLRQQPLPLDAWFLDGFAPGRNPAMWSEGVMAALAATCRTDTQVATFTVAGAVRRALQAVGFELRRVDQRPHKRESLHGTFRAAATSDVPNASVPEQATVLGAGLAGAYVARQLAERGVAVRVYDPLGPGGQSAGLPAIVLHTRLLGDRSHQAAIRAHALHQALHQQHNRFPAPPCGALQLPGATMDNDKMARIASAYEAHSAEQAYWIQALSQEQASEVAGIPLPDEALFFPGATVLDPGAQCRALLDHPAIDCVTERLEMQVSDTHSTPVIISCGAASQAFTGLEWLELHAIGGRLTQIESATQPVRLPLLGGGYFIPQRSGALIGSTYEHRKWSAEEARQHNLNLNSPFLPDHYQVSVEFRGQRCVPSDRVPVIGQVAENVWLATGFGSMGASFAPFAASLISGWLCDGFAPVAQPLAALLAPGRFLDRQARRGPLKRSPAR